MRQSKSLAVFTAFERRSFDSITATICDQRGSDAPELDVRTTSSQYFVSTECSPKSAITSTALILELRLVLIKNIRYLEVNITEIRISRAH